MTDKYDSQMSDGSILKKYLCVVVKVVSEDAFIVTAYYTDAVKKGAVLWEKI
jgi:hypothetical protein